jgi:hypothetical protein
VSIRRARFGWVLGAGAIALGGCGSSSASAVATVAHPVDTNAVAASTIAGVAPPAAPSGPTCSGLVASTLAGVGLRIYGETISSENVAVAQRFVADSSALRSAIAANDHAAARSAAKSLIATGHIERLQVTTAGGHVLVDAGTAPALGAISGTLPGGARYVLSIYGDTAYAQLLSRVSGSGVALYEHGHLVSSWGVNPAPAAPPPAGPVSIGSASDEAISFNGDAFPAGHAQIELFVPPSTVSCGSSSTATKGRTIGAVAQRIYAGEVSSSAVTAAVARVRSYGLLMSAIRSRNKHSIEVAIDNLLSHHIVRIRVGVPGMPIDIGGPYVLAPVATTVRVGGSSIPVLLSVQDDAGFFKLVNRFTGATGAVKVGSQEIVLSATKSILISDTAPAAINPANAAVFSFPIKRFPSGSGTALIQTHG